MKAKGEQEEQQGRVWERDMGGGRGAGRGLGSSSSKAIHSFLFSLNSVHFTAQRKLIGRKEFIQHLFLYILQIKCVMSSRTKLNLYNWGG